MTKIRKKPSSEVFEPIKSDLGPVMAEIGSGRLKLINFQRSWKWSDSNITTLIESVAEGHPIGAVMFLETGGDKDFDYRSVEGTDEKAQADVAPSRLIMDGQQRLTSLYQTMYQSGPVRISGDRREPLRLYYMDMVAALDGEKPLKASIRSIPVNEKGIPVRKGEAPYNDPAWLYSNKIFPLNMLSRAREYDDGYRKHWDFMRDENNDDYHKIVGVFSDFREVICETIAQSKLPVILLRSSMPSNSVAKVYEKLNTTGIPLGSFDLLIAHYAALKFDLRDDWYGKPGVPGRKARIEKDSQKLITDIQPQQFLASVIMMAALEGGKDTFSINRTQILDLSLDSYVDHCDTAVKGYAEASKFLIRQAVFSPRDLPSMSLVTALAAVLGHIGRLVEKHEVRAKLLRWFWSMAYTNAYAKGVEIAAVDLPEVVRWLKSDDPAEAVPERVAAATVLDTKLLHSSKTMARSLHLNVGTALLRSRILDFNTGETVSMHVYTDGNYDMHHVFPVKWCRENGIAAERMDSVVNKTPMSFATNRRIGGRSPSEYIAALERDLGVSPSEMDRIVRTHGIDPVHLRTDDFEGFFEHRGKHVIGLVEKDIGKPVLRAADERSTSDADEEEWPENAEYRMTFKGLVAYAALREGGMTVLAGSRMTGEATPSLMATYVHRRDRLVASEAVVQNKDGTYELVEDVVIGAPSAAASIVCGSVSSPAKWRARDGFPMVVDGDGSARDLPLAEPDPQGELLEMA